VTAANVANPELRPRRRWLRWVLGIPLFILAILFGAFLYYRYVVVFEENRREALAQLCGLVREDAEPLFSYWFANRATDSYSLVIGLPLEEGIARRVAAGGLDAVVPKGSDCRASSNLLRYDEWKQGSIVPALGATRETALLNSGIRDRDGAGLHWLTSSAGYDAQALRAMLLSPGGLHLRHAKGDPDPFVYINAERRLVLLHLYYWRGLPGQY
jgi:hypothetical protein